MLITVSFNDKEQKLGIKILILFISKNNCKSYNRSYV